FAASQWSIGNPAVSFGLLMLGTAFLGIGFGFTVTALNPLTYNLVPGKESSIVTGLHVMIGCGTAAAPLYLSYFRQIGHWWWSGILAAVLILFLLLWLRPLSYQMPANASPINKSNSGIPLKVWFYGLIVFFYGTCEGTFGNWGSIYLEKQVGLLPNQVAIGLSIFWFFITFGRVVFSFLALRFSTDWLYRLAPFLVALVFLFFPLVKGETLGFTAMAIGGLGLSFYFPNSISRATADFPQYAALVSGILVAAIQLGTGVSSNAIGWLLPYFTLNTLFRGLSVSAFIMAGLAFWLLSWKIKTIQTRTT
ncbi:MAG: MFS transporter, partial [Bacteroidota bacterium]